MSRKIFVHLTIGVPKEDERGTPEIVGTVEAAIQAGVGDELVIETVVEEFAGDRESVVFYTVHPFDDEWVWDPGKSGSHPWATSSLQAAIDHANLVRLEYSAAPDVDREWIAGFWSAIYADDASDPDPTSTSAMIGWVDPLGNFTQGPEPPVDENGSWKGDRHA